MSKERTPKALPDDAASPARNSANRLALFGLITRKEKWTLSLRGRIASSGAVIILGCVFFFGVHPFLSVTKRVNTRYLVVEGWIPNYALDESIAEFKAGAYKTVFTVGADPLNGIEMEEGESLATRGAKHLEWMGMNSNLVQAVPARVKYRNRTFQSAVALRKWIEENHLPVTSLNVVTLGTHARRSRLLFEEAFEGKVRVGVISVVNRQYDPKRWWKYSEGVREVMSETIAYLYARFLFHPGKQ